MVSKLGQDILRGVLVAVILGTGAAALDTWVQVKLMRKDVDELRKDLDSLWATTNEKVVELQGGAGAGAGERLASLEEARRKLLEQYRQSERLGLAAVKHEGGNP